MSLIIIHFSQDFRRDKPQLGAFSRISNICADDNYHFIFTVSFSSTTIEEFSLAENIKVVAVPCTRNDFRLRNQYYLYKEIVPLVIQYINDNQIKIDVFFWAFPNI